MDTDQVFSSELTELHSCEATERPFQTESSYFQLNSLNEYPFSVVTSQASLFLEPTPFDIIPNKSLEEKSAFPDIVASQLPSSSISDSLISEIAASDDILFREVEQKQLEDHIFASLETTSAQPLHVSGFSGTGKTSVVLSIYSNLVTLRESGHPVVPVYLNMMKLKKRERVFAALAKEVLQHDFGADNRELLESYFKSEHAKPHVICFLDEVHEIASSKVNAFIYTIGEWSAMPTAQLVLIFISNLVDLEKSLPSKINSRINLFTVNFRCFTCEQLEQILKFKFCADALFTEDALSLFSTKLNAITSDVRAAETFLKKIKRKHKGSGRIQLGEVEKIFKDFGNRENVEFLGRLSQFKKIILAAIVKFHKEYDRTELTFEELYSATKTILKKVYFKHEASLTWDNMCKMLKDLVKAKVFGFKRSWTITFDTCLIFDFVNSLQDGLLKDVIYG